ncbi:hypothetical protein COT48_05320 [Candidatus Woesearchaeota archaeon CG08_land_8_20_14_0_20_47_9]|nr:MAG: hypothetical protein AUJ69_00880 [Candidatus Woesearchaeota archaeon CG1_02_47_18]PIO03355.1 MAG: hypothetical protein COT48_05320 [Candidatus Woesearchaeota archaeon CG08_land_8_20_14_0_20_47_9]HII29678.1 hypothetical protein [Candidatus Woesearchaeota archaeon]
MSQWKITKLAEPPNVDSCILIEGLPGIGNVGKVVVDFIIEALEAERIFDVFSYHLPHSVFINENNLVELPSIEVYFKGSEGKRPNLLLLAGNVQPIEEVASYELAESVLDIVERFRGSEVITLGGIGVSTIPKKPRVYCTGNCREGVLKYSDGSRVSNRLFGVVGPIIGISGLLLGLAKKRRIVGVSLLAETYAHPMFLGVRGAREIVRLLNSKLALGLDVRMLDFEIKRLESRKGMRKREKDFLNKSVAFLKQRKGGPRKDVTYIG